MPKLLTVLTLTVLSSILAVSLADSKENKEIKVTEVAKKYKTYKRMTKSAVAVNLEMALMCRSASQKEIEAAKKEKGPHAMTWVNMYMNEIAAKAFAREPYKFPVGSIIVKDKSGDDNGVGGMIKRKPGYDAKNGDWEYFYFTKKDKISSGKIPSCVKCHSAQAKNDYVFGDWSKRKGF